MSERFDERVAGFAFAQVPVGILVADAHGAVCEANHEAERLLGRSRAELVGHALATILPSALRELPRTAGDDSGAHEYAYKHPDGRESQLEWRVRRAKDEVDALSFVTLVERPPRADADRRFEAAVESAPSGMLLADGRGVILLVNREAERLFGAPRTQLVGMRVDSLVPERLRGGHPEHRAHFLSAPRSRPMGAGRELFARRIDGTEIPVEIALNPIHTDEGVLVLASIVDITARRDAEHAQRERDGRDRQRQKLEAIGTLAGGIAHDFNNLLLGIVGYTELVQRAVGPRPDIQADLEQIQRSAERGRQLVQRILTFSRQRETARVAQRLERSVREAMDLLRATLPSTIELRSELAPNTPSVLLDDTELHQILLNLATNSAHAMEGSGTIDIQVAPFEVDAVFAARHPGMSPGSFARLTVIDNGQGMPTEVRERAFEPFFTTKPIGKGTGLGLSVIHGIARSLGGAIELWSEPGRGTRVDLLFPASADELPADVPAAQADKGARPLHVLFVEDEPALAAMEKRQLESLGYQVTLHTSSLSALEDFRTRPDAFDALMTDNTMPRMTGLALAQEILRARPELPVLMVSGIAQTEDADGLAALGIGAVLAKPHSARQLGEALAKLLGKG